MKVILKNLKNKKNRNATFVCSLSYKDERGKITTVQGNLKGTISNKIIGKKGFGYDPIFIPKGKKLHLDKYLMQKKLKWTIDF